MKTRELKKNRIFGSIRNLFPNENYVMNFFLRTEVRYFILLSETM